jgi:hypothetical protein
MDPYLEGSLWMSVHTQLTAQIARQLAPLLRPRYLALTTERFVWEQADDVAVMTGSLYPDVGVAEARRGSAGDGGLAVAAAPLRLATVVPEAVPHVTVEIRDVAERRLVTAVEVLSPTNKRGEGREEYLLRRRRLLLSTAHLMEIDLLREGRRVPMREPLPPHPYFVFLSRAESRPVTDIWPIALADRLPTVPVPLLPGDDDVRLDLQAALATIYDLLGYDLALDYGGPPEVPLSSEASSWAEARLRDAGLRGGEGPRGHDPD